jgi:hypothetical protein
MKNGFTRGAAAGGVIVAMLYVTSSSLAGSGINGVFNLGVTNQVDQTTTLKGKALGPQLDISNTSTATGSSELSLTGGTDTAPTLGASNPRGQAANFHTSGGAPPFTVNSTATVTNLNADQLDRLNSTALVATNGKAADTDLLDGVDSTQFVQGPGVTISHAEAIGPGGAGTYLGPGFGEIQVGYLCPTTLTANGTVSLADFTGGPVNVFYDSGQANPTYVQMGAGDQISVPAAAAGDSVTFQIQGNLGGGYGIGTVFVDTVNRLSDCHFQVQGLWTAGQ